MDLNEFMERAAALKNSLQIRKAIILLKAKIQQSDEDLGVDEGAMYVNTYVCVQQCYRMVSWCTAYPSLGKLGPSHPPGLRR